ncbi:MAG: DNA-deoxyinosine glycosylase [Erysipelotrichaceae bacterium]|nr:DNA-deoxyinosine glycosylase [Erysipelotrichaceae bacterium]
MKENRVIHPLPPVYDENSRVLILGSFPSVKSRETGFFYGHPRNRFWMVLAEVFEDDVPVTIAEKKRFLLKHGVAVWDVIASCEIRGSSDSSITNVRVNDLSIILNKADIKDIYVNGGKAESIYEKYMEKQIGRKCVRLPSTSPANAAWSLDRLTESWKIIRECN